MGLFTMFIKLMKSELSGKKRNSFAWALNEEKFLRLSDVRKLRRACREAENSALERHRFVAGRDRFMIELGLNAGLRVEEMAELRCGDLHIRDNQSSLSVRRGKGGKPRTVKINEMFRNECRRFLGWKQKYGHGTDSESFLLTSGEGNQLSTRALQKAFKRCMARAGLPEHYSIHALRHTYGAHLYLSSNHNLRLVQEHLGHSSVRVTEVYASLMDSDARKAVEGLYK